MSTSARPQLDYAPAAPILRRKRTRRLILTLILISTIWPSNHYLPPLWQKSKLLYHQHRCLTFTAPPDQIVYDDDPADLAAVAARPNYQLLSNRYFAAPSFPKLAAYTPPCWNDFTAAALPNRSPVGAAVPAQTSIGGAAIIFCHELTSHDAVRRLVIVQRNSDPGQFNYNYLQADFLIIQPATFTTNPVDLTPPQSQILYTGATAIQSLPLRIYAGQPDPADPSRFTIRYTMGQHEHLLEGRLNDGGNLVTLTYLNPIPQPAP